MVFSNEQCSVSGEDKRPSDQSVWTSPLLRGPPDKQAIGSKATDRPPVALTVLQAYDRVPHVLNSSIKPGESPQPLGAAGATWASFAQLIRLPNQSGTLLLMLPTWWALMLASHGRPPLMLMAVFAVGAFLMRSAGVAINDWADRRIDREVARTRNRPLASGILGAWDAACAIAILLACAATLLLMLPPLAMALSPLAVMLAAAYPFSKRVIALPQVILGLAFGWGVIMAWAAVRNTVEGPAWLIYLATVCWAVGYDTIYALQDREDDRRIGVKSSAVWLGTNAWLAVACAFSLMLGCLALSGLVIGLGLVFYGTLAAVGGFLSQQVVAVRRKVDAARAFALFRQHVWVGWAILGAIWAGFL